MSEIGLIEGKALRNRASCCFLAVLFITSLTSTVVALPKHSLARTLETSTTIAVYPPSSVAKIGETFAVNITIINVLNLYGWQFNLTFNPSILNVIDVVEGPFLSSVDSTVWPAPHIDNSAGHVMAAAAFLPPYAPYGADGSGTLASVTFQVNSFGQTPLAFEKDDTMLRTVADGVIYPIEHETFDGYFSARALSVSIDIKPGSWPNSINVKSNSVFAVAICGTADLDVTTIDPATIRICIEGVVQGVLPERWGYADVATPYIGEPGSGHELKGDGYTDLVLRYHTHTVVSMLGLAGHLGETIALIIKGNLKATSGGLPIQGQDYVWIRVPSKTA